MTDGESKLTRIMGINSRPNVALYQLAKTKKPHVVEPEGGYPEYLVICRFKGKSDMPKKVKIGDRNGDIVNFLEAWHTDYRTVRTYSNPSAATRSTNILGLICLNPKPGIDEQRHFKWLTEVHIPLVMRFPRVIEASCNYIVEPRKDYPKYVDMYAFARLDDFEAFDSSKEVAEAREEYAQSWGGQPSTLLWWVAYQRLGELA